MRRQKRTII